MKRKSSIRSKMKRVNNQINQTLRSFLSQPQNWGVKGFTALGILFLISIQMGTTIVPSMAQTTTNVDVNKYTTRDTIYLSEAAIVEVNTTSSLIWSFGDYGVVEVNLSPRLADVNGTVNITLIDFQIIDAKKDEKYASYVEVIEQSLNGNQTLNVKKVIETPDVERFTLSIGILASSNVSSVATAEKNYEIKYPDGDLSIQVQRDNLAAILQLPGFPEMNMFLTWLIYFGGVVLLLSLPLFAILGIKFVQRQQVNEKRKQQQENKGGEWHAPT